MQDRPTDVELLATIGDWLEEELLPELEGGLRYRGLVALNLVRILGRERQFATAQLLAERDRLCGVLGVRVQELAPGTLADQVAELEQQLAERLAADDVDDAFLDATWHVLMASTRDKLAVVRPGYDAHPPETEAP